MNKAMRKKTDGNGFVNVHQLGGGGWRARMGAALAVLVGLCLVGYVAQAATPGLPFTEDFSDDSLMDATHTTAVWSEGEAATYLGWRHAKYGAFDSSTAGTDITTDSATSRGLGFGDVDGDGDLDLVVGNIGVNRLYLNDGDGDPFDTATGADITSNSQDTRALALGDMDGDGDLDVVAGNDGGVNRLYLNNGTADPFNGVTGLDISSETQSTRAIAVGDLNGDGYLDVVAGNNGQVNRVYLNTGGEDPFDGVSGVNIGTTNRATRGIALCDLNGDGHLDLVTGNYNQANRRYLGVGDGTFASAANITGDAHQTTSLAVGDVDGNGTIDVVIGNGQQTNRLYLNDGLASFTSEGDITADAHVTRGVALADADNDGDLDLFVGNNDQNNRLYLNNGFAVFTGSDLTTDTEDLTQEVAVGDIDGDGDVDMVAGNAGINRLYQNPAARTPFIRIAGANVSEDTGVIRKDVAVGDMDGDGDLDVVVAVFNEINRLYLSNGDGTFAAGKNITADSALTYGIALGDLDGDGDLDVVVGNDGRNRLYLNNGTADPFNGITGTDITTNSHLTLSITVGDLDGDGDLDVIAGNGGQRDRVYLNNGTADPFNGVSGADLSTDAYDAWELALGDVDGDGDLDAVIATSSGEANKVYRNNGDGSFDAGTSYTSTTSLVRSLAVADVDNDGDLDIVVGSAQLILHKNNGAGVFASGTAIDYTTRTFRYLVAGDVNGDGAPDVVLATGAGEEDYVYLNKGKGTFRAAAKISDDTRDNTGAALGDMDGDGYLDVVTVSRVGTQRPRLYLNTGVSKPLNLAAGRDLSEDTDASKAVAVGDVDGDGHLDAVIGNDGQTNQLFVNNGTANPFMGVAGTDVTSDAQATRNIALGDLDGDGDLDVVAGNYGQVNRLYLNNGTADPFNGVSGANISGDTHYTRSVAVGDVDNDGDLDVVAGSYLIQRNWLYLNNGTANPFDGVTGLEITSDAHSTNGIALADMDGDGDLDVVAGNISDPSRLYLNNGTADPFNGVSGIDITSDVNNTMDIVLEDVNGDGHLDFVVGADILANRLYLNNGTTNPFSGVTGSNISDDALHTYGISVADVDSDGDLDVVTAQQLGRERIYLNNGTSTPFSGAIGIDVTSANPEAYDVALGDLDRDGTVDVLVAVNGARNRVYQLGRLYNPLLNRVQSLTVDTESGNIDNALMEATVTLPPGTCIDWRLSNDGGGTWLPAVLGDYCVFPSTTGSNLRWKAVLHTLSPTASPLIDIVEIDSDLEAPTVEMISTAPNPTNTSPIPVTVAFSEPVTGFDSGDVVLANATLDNFAGADADYSFDLTPLAQGLVTADIGAGVAQDAASNGNTAATQFSRTFDSEGPTVAMTSGATDPTYVSPIPVTVNFSEAVTGFESADVFVSNAVLDGFGGSGADYTFDLIPLSEGLVTADICVGAARDAAGNDSTAAPQFTREYSLIHDVTALQAMQDDLAGNYALGNDIDASDTINWNGGAGFERIGTATTKFTGTFDGNGYVVTGLYINRPSTDNVGLFGALSSGASVSNVGFLDVDVTGDSDVGGLVGANRGAITACYTTGAVSGAQRVGGLVGYNPGDITDSYSTATVSGSGRVGGLVGAGDDGTLTSCYSTGAVSGDSWIGGLVGRNTAIHITNSYSTGAVTGTSKVGGLVGLNNSSSVTCCYSTGAVSGDSDVGGLVGLNTGNVTSSYWDMESSGQATSAAGTGKTTAEMKQESTFVGWDFATPVWGIVEDWTYPYLDGLSVGTGLEQGDTQADPAYGLPVAFEVVFSEAVSGFDEADVDFSQSTIAVSGHTVTDLGGGASWLIEVTAVDAFGAIVARIPAGACTGAVSGAPNSVSASADNAVTVANTPPEAQDPGLNPLSPRTGNDLSLSYTYYDENGHPQVREQIFWFRNGHYRDEWKNQNPLPSSATAKGEEWHANVRVFDGYDWSEWAASAAVTILNTPGEILNPVISPPEPRTDDKLPVTYEYSDADGDPMTLTQIYWYKYEPSNKKFIRQILYDNKKRLPAIATKKGDRWYANVRAKDGEEWGPWSAAPTVVILNTPPEARDVLISPPLPRDEDDLMLSFSYYDADGDPNTSRQILWFKDGVRQDAYKNSTRVAPRFTSPGEEWVAKVRFFDGEEWGSWCWSNLVVIGSKGSSDARDVDTVDQSALAFAELPQGGWFEEGESFTLSVAVSGAVGPVAYQWTKDGVDIPDETFWTFEVVAATSYDEGAYTCRATDEAKGVSDETPPAFVRVFAVGSLPVAGLAGLCILMAVLVLGGAWAVHRTRCK